MGTSKESSRRRKTIFPLELFHLHAVQLEVPVRERHDLRPVDFPPHSGLAPGYGSLLLSNPQHAPSVLLGPLVARLRFRVLRLDRLRE